MKKKKKRKKAEREERCETKKKEIVEKEEKRRNRKERGQGQKYGTAFDRRAIREVTRSSDNKKEIDVVFADESLSWSMLFVSLRDNGERGWGGGEREKARERKRERVNFRKRRSPFVSPCLGDPAVEKTECLKRIDDEDKCSRRVTTCAKRTYKLKRKKKKKKEEDSGASDQCLLKSKERERVRVRKLFAENAII